VLLTYRERYLALKADPRVKLVLIFKNYGERAGSSIAHPHSQVIATPIIPGHIRRKYEVAVQHYDDTGRCLLSRRKIDTVSELFIDPTSFSYLSLMPHGSHSKLG
jgi:UDPglucose--hexose-1-phosphate uridylyltransferase